MPLRFSHIASMALGLAGVAFLARWVPGQEAKAPAQAAQDARPPLVPWPLSTPAPLPSDHISRIDSFAQSACYACHREVTEEWAGTLHAAAWLDDLYQASLRDVKKPEACHGCHIPSTVFGLTPGAPPLPRSDDLHFGVSCQSCHQTTDGAARGEVLGPHGASTDAHPTRKDPAMSVPGSNALCASCHRVTIGPVIGIAKDFELSGQAGKEKSCVGCHMAPVERRWANLPDGSPDTSLAPRIGHSHALQTPRDPAFLRRAFQFRLELGPQSTRLGIENQAGHRVGGLKGRSIEFEVTLLRADGTRLGTQKKTIDTQSYLPVGGRLDFEFEVRADMADIVGTFLDERAKTPAGSGVEFCRERLRPSQ